MESLDSAVDGGLPSVTQEPQFTSLGLELSEQPTIVDDIAEETAVASHLTEHRGIPPSSSSSFSSKALASMDAHVSQGSADLTANVITLKGNETSISSHGYGGLTMQQKQGETTQMVAIIPTQVRLKGCDR